MNLINFPRLARENRTAAILASLSATAAIITNELFVKGD